MALGWTQVPVGGSWEDEACPFSQQAGWEGEIKSTHKTEVQTGSREKFLPSYKGPAVTQLAQKSCAVTVTECCEDLTG